MSDVTIYTGMLCGFCSAAKRLLKAKNVAFTEIDVTFSPAKRSKMIELAGGQSTVPQIFIGKTHVGGCDDLYALEDEGKLDGFLAL
jgi:glutaredoxin 3